MFSENNAFEPSLDDELIEIDDNATYLVTVFNNDYNTFEEVIFIIQKAIHCSHEVAEHIAWEIHNKGQADVMIAPYVPALKAARLIRTIGLKVTIQKECC